MTTLGQLLYTAVDGSFAVDSNQRIIYWDPGCEELLGFSENWVLGRPCSEVLAWQSPTSNKLVCQQKCPVAELCNGGNNQEAFFVQGKDKNNDQLNLTISIVLVPSTCKKNWHVMHLLHRNPFPDVLSAMSNSHYKNPSRTVASRAINSDIGADDRASRLTQRESEVLALMSEGISGSTIAKKLNISNTTVRNHIQHIQGKLGVHSKTEAVAYAYRHNFL